MRFGENNVLCPKYININEFRGYGGEVHIQVLKRLSKLRRGECKDFWKEIKALKPKKESLPLAILQTYGKIISVQ